jgi:hypothetical protein
LLKQTDDVPSSVAKQPSSQRTPSRQPVRATANAPRRSASRAALFGAFAVLLVLNLAALATAFWFYQNRVAPRLNESAAPSVSDAPSASAPEIAPLQTALGQANGQIQELQKQIDAQRVERERAQARLQEMADRMALVLQQNAFVAPQKDATAVTDPGQGQMATLLPSVSPSTSELILLKERNRISGFADTAIATGSREALQRIVDVMLDPEMKHLLHAAQAEFKRVQAYYEVSISIDPNYKLPLRELFADGSVQAEADLAPEQLQKLMLDLKQPWEARLRCAYLLRAGTAAGIDEALLKVIKEDPSLDVAKQAQTSFERRVGRRFRLFDIPAIDAWWQAQGAAKAPPVPMKAPAVEAR